MQTIMQDENLLTRPSERNIVIPPTRINVNDSGFTGGEQ